MHVPGAGGVSQTCPPSGDTAGPTVERDLTAARCVITSSPRPAPSTITGKLVDGRVSTLRSLLSWLLIVELLESAMTSSCSWSNQTAVI